jgi:mRNA interferase RelE/StbE
MPGWATQIYSRECDAALARIPAHQRRLIEEKITDMGRRLATFPHYRMTGRAECRLRVGDYRVIYLFDTARNEISVITVGHRREVYRES